MLSFIITLIIVGVLLYCVNQYLPMDGKIKNILNIVIVVCVVFWLLAQFGVFHYGHDIPVPQVR